jgi:AraC-like DNA-binding protein
MNILVRSATLAKYSDVARGLGIDPVQMVCHAGLDRQCLLTPDLRVPEALVSEVFEESAQAAQCATLGLMVGASWRLSDFGVISLLLQHQPTLRHTLQELQRNRHLISDSVVIDLAEYPNVAVLQMALVTGRAHPGRQRMELAIGALLSLCRSQLGAHWLPRRVHFSHTAPVSLLEHQKVFGSAIEFGAEFDGIVLAKEDLDKVNPASDANMAKYAQNFIDLQPRVQERNIAHDVRRSVHVLLPRGRSNIDQVSQSLGISTRTLQRQLEQRGENFQSLVNDVRREQAISYLEGKTHSITQITQLLGFAETSAFSRWFSQQFNSPPSRWKSN